MCRCPNRQSPEPGHIERLIHYPPLDNRYYHRLMDQGLWQNQQLGYQPSFLWAGGNDHAQKSHCQAKDTRLNLQKLLRRFDHKVQNQKEGR